MKRIASASLILRVAGARRPSPLLRVAAVLLLALALSCPGPVRAEGETQFFRIGSGVVDSPSFAVAGIVATGISSPPGARPCERGGSCGVPGMIALAQAIGSPAEAVELLEQRQIDAVLVPAGDAYRAHVAKHPDAAKPRAALRTVATLFVEAIHVVVREGARYETIDDLKRRAIAAATDDPSATGFLQHYMREFGVDSARKPVPMLTVEAALQRLGDGHADGLVVLASAPLPALAEFARASRVRLLAPTPAATQRLPFLTEVRLPAGSYAFVDATDLQALPTQLVVAASADANRVEAITRALWNEATQKLLAAGPPIARTVKLEHALAGIAVPLHPGAARFYREAGVLANTPVGE